MRKNALTTGIWANEGFNDDKGTRAKALEDIDRQFEEASKVIYFGEAEVERIADQHRFTQEDEQNPFLRPAIEATRKHDVPLDEGDTKLIKAVQEDLDIDQN